MKRKITPAPNCPTCNDTLIPFRRERVTWETWAYRWYCRKCGNEQLTPDTTTK